MSEQQSKKLVVNQRVMWEQDQSDLGTVIETGYNSVKIKWDNGQVGVVDHRDMKNINISLKVPA